MSIFVKQEDADKVNGYVVVDFHNSTNVHYECERRYWGREVFAMYQDLAKTNIRCPMVPFEVMEWNAKNPNKNPRIAYFTILDD